MAPQQESTSSSASSNHDGPTNSVVEPNGNNNASSANTAINATHVAFPTNTAPFSADSTASHGNVDSQPSGPTGIATGNSPHDAPNVRRNAAAIQANRPTGLFNQEHFMLPEWTPDQFRAHTTTVGTPLHASHQPTGSATNHGQSDHHGATPTGGSSDHSGNKRPHSDTNTADENPAGRAPYRGGNFQPFRGAVPTRAVQPEDTTTFIENWVERNHVHHDFTWMDIAENDEPYAINLFDALMRYFGVTENIVRNFRALPPGRMMNWLTSYSVEALDNALDATRR